MVDENAYLEQVKAIHAIPLWKRPETTDRAPLGQARPMVWRWAEVAPLLYAAADIALGEAVHRRVLSLANPGLTFTAAATDNLGAGFQLILPGEAAPAHRHSMAALRWIVDADAGAVTVVDGEPVPMETGDLILTPAGSWHDHRHGGRRPVVWLDGLDAPLVRRLGAVFQEGHPAVQQPLTAAPDASRRLHGQGGVWPRGPGLVRPALWRYPLSAARSVLEAQAASGPPDPWRGYRVEYAPPGQNHAFPTMACYLDMLPPGFASRPLRSLASTVIHVVSGHGYAVIDGVRLSWQARDTLAVPAWSWCRQVNLSPDEPALLFSYSDLPALEALGLAREERKAGEPT